MAVTKTISLEKEIQVLKKKMESLERKMDYLISLVERDEDFSPEEVEELDRLAEKIEKGEEPTYPVEEVFKRLGLNIS